MVNRLGLAMLALCVGWGIGAQAASAKEFTYDAKLNERLAAKMKIPVFFAVPASARAPLAKDITIPDRLVDFKHPDAAGAQGDVGLRLILGKRAGMAKRLAKSGLVQTGDLLLSVRPEWGGAGPYPNVQMGISHVGLAYIKNGAVHNLDNPMDAEFLGPNLRGELNGAHYNGLNFIHIIRPRNLTEAERQNLLDWITRLAASPKTVYPSQVSFNQNYNAPKYQPGKPVAFVKHLGQVALGQTQPGPIDLYCSEFAWSLLALRDCDPDTTAEAFKASGVPSCVKPAMTPLNATGDYILRRGPGSTAGLGDGPLLVIDSMGLPEDRRTQTLKAVFTQDEAKLKKMSTGHRKLAEEMKPHFSRLEDYYLDVYEGRISRWQAQIARFMFNRAVPDNYSPTSYLINTLLPPDNQNRTMDYVATIAIE
jgi:hypothetical protein